MTAAARPAAPLTHEANVAAAFGPQAAAYVASAVHASGEDLAAFAALLEGHADAHLLDLGCGGGHVSFTAAPLVRAVTAYDLSPDMLGAVAAEAKARGLSNIETRQGVAEALPFADATFDIVASRYSAHHWRDVAAGVREARRVVKSGGLAIFMDVIAPEAPLLDTFLQGIELLRDPSHVRDYRASEWESLARHAGFTVIETTPRRLRLDFPTWVARIGTSAPHIVAIRSLEAGAPEEVRRHFSIEEDGTFTLDTLTLALRAA